MREPALGQRMKKAAMKKHLYREQPFVIQRNASMLDDGWKNETVLVQGIIDAYFMEEEEIVLVDYKTDPDTFRFLLCHFLALQKSL